MQCPHCQSERTVKNGQIKASNNVISAKDAVNASMNSTLMARLRNPSTLIAAALNVRTEGLGVRATGRSFGKSHSTIIRWEQRLARQLEPWSPPAPDGADITLEGDEVYTRVGENLPPL